MGVVYRLACPYSLWRFGVREVKAGPIPDQKKGGVYLGDNRGYGGFFRAIRFDHRVDADRLGLDNDVFIARRGFGLQNL